MYIAHPSIATPVLTIEDSRADATRFLLFRQVRRRPEESTFPNQLTKNVNLTHLCGRFFICFVPNGPEVA